MISDQEEKKNTIWVYRIDQRSEGVFRLSYVHADDPVPRGICTYVLRATDEIGAWMEFKSLETSHHVEMRGSDDE